MPRRSRETVYAALRKTFGKNLRSARVKAGMTQAKVAEAAGRNRSYVSDVERGVHNVTLEIMADLADVVGREVAELLTAEKKRPRR